MPVRRPGQRPLGQRFGQHVLEPDAGHLGGVLGGQEQTQPGPSPRRPGPGDRGRRGSRCPRAPGSPVSPMRTWARVLLPEPFGPMTAWTSPLRTTRSTPARTSCRPTLGPQALDHQLVTGAFGRGCSHGRSRELHEHVVAVDDARRTRARAWWPATIWGSPVRRSKVDPCFQHSISHSSASTSPSDRE